MTDAIKIGNAYENLGIRPAGESLFTCYTPTLTFVALQSANKTMFRVGPGENGDQLGGKVEVFRTNGEKVAEYVNWDALCDAIDRRPML